MGQEARSFTCVLLQKRLVLGDREQAQREQQLALEELVQGRQCDSSVVLLGGCLYSKGLAIGEGVDFVAAVSGSLDNSSALIEKYLPEVRSNGLLKDAELICQLYNHYGRAVPQKLQGSFSFVLFDPLQGRVLAVVSPTSDQSLVQARGEDGSLIISTSEAELPPGSHSVTSISQGFMKYGWSSDPQRYATPHPANPRQEVHLSPSARASAARMAFSGTDSFSSEGVQGSQASVQTSGPSFPDSEGGEPQSPAPKKTRRGKRGGRNQKLRAESMKQMAAGDLGRTSLDLGSIPSASMMSACSFNSRADEQNWWRTNTPGTSLDLPSNSQGNYSGAVTPPPRRFSMSAAAPAFVPGQPNYFARQSVPATRSQITALSFPGRGKNPQVAMNEAFVSAAHREGSEDTTMVSPFLDNGREVETAKASKNRMRAGKGKADAAWEESPAGPSDSSVSPRTHGSAPTDPKALSSVKEEGNAGHQRPAPASKDRAPSSDMQAGQQGVIPRVATGLESKHDKHEDEDSIMSDSPRGASPGSSPTSKPPKIPMGAFRHFFKSMIPRRGSHDLWAEAGPQSSSQKNWAKSSSHGNLVGLHGSLTRPEASGADAGSLSGTQGLQTVAAQGDDPLQVTSRDDTARQLAGKPHGNQEDVLLQKLKLTEPVDVPAPGSHTTAAHWIAQKTRSMFGKSKSCTDLHNIDRGLTQQPVEMEVK